MIFLMILILLKVTKKQGLTSTLENIFLENHRGRGGGQFDPPSNLELIYLF